MAALRRRNFSDDESSNVQRVDSMASSSPDSLVAHLQRASSFLREQNSFRGSTSLSQLSRNTTSHLDLASILTDAVEIMDGYGNDGDEVISSPPFAPPHSPREPKGPSRQ